MMIERIRSYPLAPPRPTHDKRDGVEETEKIVEVVPDRRRRKQEPSPDREKLDQQQEQPPGSESNDEAQHHIDVRV